ALVWGKEVSFPQLRLGSCFAPLRILQSKTGLATPGSHNPLPLVPPFVCGVASATVLFLFV
ncbi:MAG: hypothetical protein WC880_03350, partial [Candidatus Paceibacterota bacterium]